MTDIPILRSERLAAAGFPHGFSTRAGGVSDGPFASLNLSRSVGDDPSRVEENHRRLACTVGYQPDRLFTVHQVHGATVVTLHGSEQPEEVRSRHADALVTREPGFALGVRVADCVPVLLADRHTGAVAAIHAGWRGVVAGVVRETVRSLAPQDPSHLIAAIGPSIGPCCFEVGEDVAVTLAHAAGDGIVIRRPYDRPHVDLWRAVEHQLRSAGVPTIDTLGECTVCNSQRFFSYRRDGVHSGRMLAVIVAPGRQ